MKMYFIWAVLVLVVNEYRLCFAYGSAQCQSDLNFASSTNLSQTIGLSQRQCAEKCHSDKVCAAYITSPLPEGGCYLKSGYSKLLYTSRPGITACVVNSHDTKFICNETYTCVGNNIEQMDVSLCKQQCDDKVNCAGFAVGHDGQCLLKSHCNSTHMRIDLQKRETCVKTKDFYECHRGVDCPDNHTQSLIGVNCEEECDKHPTCDSYGVVNGRNICHLNSKCKPIHSDHSVWTCFKYSFAASPFARIETDEYVFDYHANYSCSCNNIRPSYEATESGCKKDCKENTLCVGYVIGTNGHCFLKSSCDISKLKHNPAIRTTCLKGKRGITPVPNFMEFIVELDIDLTVYFPETYVTGLEICSNLQNGITDIQTELSALSPQDICSADKIKLFLLLKLVQTGSEQFCVDKCEDTLGQMIEQLQVMGATMCNLTPDGTQVFDQVNLALDTFLIQILMPMFLKIRVDDMPL